MLTTNDTVTIVSMWDFAGMVLAIAVVFFAAGVALGLMAALGVASPGHRVERQTDDPATEAMWYVGPTLPRTQPGYWSCELNSERPKDRLV